MPLLPRFACVAAVLFASFSAAAQDASWNEPQQPFRIYGNAWYVGSKGLSAILIASPQGHVLIDGTLPENAGMIEANIRTLGFDVRDVRAILNSHAHSDHAGAITALARSSGATVWASAIGAEELRVGGDYPDDPQYGKAPHYPPVTEVSVVADGGTVRVGNELVLTAQPNPGHTLGSTTWSWRSCEAGRCLDLVYADSLTLFSHDDFRFGDQVARPHLVGKMRRGLAALAALPCDILITPHPGASDFMERVAARDNGLKSRPLIDTQACKNYAAKGEAGLDARLAKERGAGVAHD